MCYVLLKADKHNYMLVDTNLKSWFFIPKIIVKQSCVSKNFYYMDANTVIESISDINKGPQSLLLMQAPLSLVLLRG